MKLLMAEFDITSRKELKENVRFYEKSVNSLLKAKQKSTMYKV